MHRGELPWGIERKGGEAYRTALKGPTNGRRRQRGRTDSRWWGTTTATGELFNAIENSKALGSSERGLPFSEKSNRCAKPSARHAS